MTGNVDLLDLDRWARDGAPHEWFRDEAHFDDPDRFDVGRTPNHHIAFGGGGPHFCLGASLARLEVRVLLEALVERYDTISLAGPVERVRSNFLQGIKHLPVTLA